MIYDRPTYLRVDLDALAHNYIELNRLSENKECLAVIKANAYGLGAKVVARHLYKNGARFFATATLEEAIEIKEDVKDSLILVLGVTNPKNIKYAIENDISLTCPSKEWLEAVIGNLENLEGKLKVHVKLETGMNRIGAFDKDEILEIDKLLNSEKIDFEGVFSHYSNADGDDDIYDEYQTKNFEERVNLFTKRPKYIHIENSAGTMKYNERDDRYTLSRIGIALYGEYPSDNIKRLEKVSLKTVASLLSKVTHVKKVDKGTKIGYGITYEAENDEYIATIPAGYADGVLRRAQGFKLNIAGEECEIVGRVCMDQLMVRCSKNIKVGDDVIIYGEYNGEKISVDEFASYQGTISYEVFCCISPRIPRKYYINDTEL